MHEMDRAVAARPRSTPHRGALLPWVWVVRGAGRTKVSPLASTPALYK